MKFYTVLLLRKSDYCFFIFRWIFWIPMRLLIFHLKLQRHSSLMRWHSRRGRRERPASCPLFYKPGLESDTLEWIPAIRLASSCTGFDSWGVPRYNLEEMVYRKGREMRLFKVRDAQPLSFGLFLYTRIPRLGWPLFLFASSCNHRPETWFIVSELCGCSLHLRSKCLLIILSPI